MNNNKRAILVVVLLGVVAASGCVGGPSDQGDSKDNLAELKEHHIRVDCGGTISGVNRVSADVPECTAKLVRGSHLQTTVTFTGHDDNTGTIKKNRQSTMVATTYYPNGEGNSQPNTVTYNVEDGNEETFKVVATITTQPGFGTYELCFDINGYVDSSPMWPGLQAKPKAVSPSPCIKYAAQKDSVWGRS